MMSENMTSPVSASTPVSAASQNLNVSMADIEQSVSRLLMTTKKLLETLTAWSAGQVGDTAVYDEYNALEVHFANATQAFETVLLPMEDMLHLPDDLFSCLKETLSKEPCSLTLEQHLPSIRDTILRLLQGLKKKQSLLRERFEPSTSKLLSRAQQQQLSPLSTSPITLPSPSTSTEPPIKHTAIHSSVPISPASTEEFDMNDPTTKDAMTELCTQGNLAGRSSIRRSSNYQLYHPQKKVSVEDPKLVTFFLKMGDRVKKVHFDQSKLNLQAIYELFRNKFSLMTAEEHQVTVLDSESNVEYELEDLADIKPYSIISIHDTSHHDELKLLIEVTMRKVLHEMQFNNGATAVTPSNIPHEQIQEQKDELDSLRHDLLALQKIYADFKEKTKITIDELKEKSKQAVHKPQPSVILNTAAREEMHQNREITQTAATLLTNKLEVLQDTIDQIKLDVTQRRCRPPKNQLEQCQTESDCVRMEIENLSTKVKTLKPTWKKMWEVELQQIVKEQQFLKEQEALMIDLKDDHEALVTVLNQLKKISEIQERKKQAGVSLFKLAPVEEGFEGMSSVMKQVSTIHVDHSRRVKALAEAEKSRSKELSQRIDAFEKELTDFVGLSKLKKTGGAEAIEKQREEKQKDFFKQISASTATSSSNDLIHDKGDVDETASTPDAVVEEEVEHNKQTTGVTNDPNAEVTGD